MKHAAFAPLLGLGLGSLLLLYSASAGATEVAAKSAAPQHVYAPLPGSDGVYGRLDGSLTLAFAAGAELEADQPRGALRVSAHYLWTAGAYARYSDAFGSADSRPERVLSVGVDLRPLFLPRFGLDVEQGPALLDLTLDSLSLTAGAYFAEPGAAAFGDAHGFEGGLGFGLPLMAQAKGLWLDARAERRFADRGENAWLFTLSLSLHVLTWSTTQDAR
jgi:hypothetical protein